MLSTHTVLCLVWGLLIEVSFLVKLKSFLKPVLVFLLLTGHVSHAAEDTTPSRVLMLFGSSDIGAWEQSYSQAFFSALNSVSNANVSLEFLGLDSTNGIGEELLADSISLRHSSRPIDLIIAVQPAASVFLDRWGDVIAPNSSKLHVLPNTEILNKVQRSGEGEVLESAFSEAARNTIQLLPDLIPDLATIFVLSGASDADRDYLSRVKQVEMDSDTNIEFIYYIGMTTDELISNLQNPPENSAVLLVTYDNDHTGQIVKANAITEVLSAQISIPIFGMVDNILGVGSVGGNITSSEIYGDATASLANGMLSGETRIEAVSIPTMFVFDGELLDRWGINQNLLPEGSEIVNDEPGLIEQYFWQISLLLLVVAILLLTVVALARSLRRQYRAERERDQRIVEQGNQERLFESLINSIPDVILITDTDENIFDSNSSVHDVFGFESSELVGMNTSALLSHTGKDSNKVFTATAEHPLEPQVLKYKKKNGEIFSGETIATNVTNDSGEVLGHFALIRDVSKRLSLEEEQRQGQKMEALGNLVGGISHDFNNILGVISGYAELSLIGEDAKIIGANQSQILKATDRAKSLIAQIMTFSRDTNTGQKPTDLADLLDDTMKLVKVSIPSNIELNLHKAEGAPAVMGSAIQLQQIILNLTTNAYQAMQASGGSITISLAPAEINAEINLSHGVLKPGTYSALSISDTGPGMSQEVASRIFDPYFTTKAQGEGSGMGMAIVYNLTKAHDGILDMKTAPGEGLCITMYFRKASKLSEVLNADSKGAVVQGRGERILLVDDEEDLLDAMRQLLLRTEYRVEAFSDPNEALEAFKKAPEEFDLLVSDQSMPRLTGVQLLREARQLKPHLPAIICTGYSELLNQQDVEHLDLSSIIRKPYTLNEISQAIADALDVQ